MQGLEAIFGKLQTNSDDIGSDRPVDEDDTLKAKHAFKSIGYYDEPSWGMTPYPDQPLFDGIKKFQKDKDLFQDSLMVPKGETVTALNKELGKKNNNNSATAKLGPSDKENRVEIKQLKEKRATLIRKMNEIRSIGEGKSPDEIELMNIFLKPLEDQLKKLNKRIEDLELLIG